MAKLNDLIVTIGAQTRQFDKALGASMRKMQNFGRSTKQLGKSMTRSLTMPIAALGAAAIKSAADLETMEVSFISLTGGAKQAADMMANLNEFTAKTPFQIEAVAKSARQLIASGSGLEEVNTQLQFLGDIAATSGQPIDEIAAIFAKVNAKGKVELENLNQLAERGIPIFTALAEATGLPADKLGAGRVSVDQFNEVLKSFSEEGGFAAGAMERLSETASGKFSTALDNLKLAGAALAEDLLPIVKKLIDRFTEFTQKVQKLSPESKTLALKILAIAAAIGPVLVIVPSLIAGIEGVAGAFSFLNKTMMKNPFALVATALALVVTGIIMLSGETVKAVTAIDRLTEANKNLTLEEKKRNIEVSIEQQKTLVAQLEAEKNAKDAIVKQGYGGKAIKEQREANNAYSEANAELSEMIVMLDGVNEKLETNANKNKTGSAAVEQFTLDMVKASKVAFDLKQELAKLGTQRSELFEGTTKGKAAEVNLEFEEIEMAEMMLGDEEDWAAAGDRILAARDLVQRQAQAMGQMIAGFVDNAFRKLIDGTASFEEIMKTMIKQMAIQLASLIAQFAVLSLLMPSSLVGAGGKAVGLGQFIGGGFGIPQFASGGIVSGPVIAQVGEYSGASHNPEVIAPLDKLQSMMGGQAVQVTGKISGRDILLTSERNAIDRNRVRGF